MSIPPLKEFNVGTLTLVDTGTIIDVDEKQRARKLGQKLLIALIQKTRDTPLCRPNEFMRLRTEAWQAVATADPGADWATFNTNFDPEFDDSECDPRLDDKMLAIYRGKSSDGDLLGVFFLYNMTIVGGQGQVIEVTTYPAPAIPFVDDEDWSDTVVAIMRRMLGGGLVLEDLELQDGDILRIVSMEFPTRGTHAWVGESWVDLFVTKFMAEGFEREDTAEGRLRRFNHAAPGPRGRQ